MTGCGVHRAFNQVAERIYLGHSSVWIGTGGQFELRLNSRKFKIWLLYSDAHATLPTNFLNVLKQPKADDKMVNIPKYVASYPAFLSLLTGWSALLGLVGPVSYLPTNAFQFMSTILLRLQRQNMQETHVRLSNTLLTFHRTLTS
jgi:hypothetical protein